MPLVIHLAFPVEPENLESFKAQLPKSARVTTGDPGNDTTVLVSGRTTDDQLKSLPNLEALVIPFAGLIPATRDALLRHPHLHVYNLHHNAAATAEKAIELLFAVAKRTVTNDSAMRDGSWAPRFDAWDALELSGRRAVVLGLGEIGKRVARACLALGMTVAGVNRSGQNAATPGVTVHPCTDFSHVCQGIDVLLCCAPLTPETMGIVSSDLLASLAPDAIVVNVGRGGLIDEEALYRELSSRRLFGAGLDVWWIYPTDTETTAPSRFPIHELDNVVMSPHVGGTVKNTEKSRFDALARLLTQISSRDSGLRRVDVQAGY